MPVHRQRIAQAAVEELARYLQQHGDVLAVRAMRKEAATPEKAMRYWVLCAGGVDSGL
jgi:hypothetical protein